ncbi:transmembrane protein, putative (macronuclear) [Tetrahymena thermophila SB210]|uniref:Transmembrane protein, putative n=1 Tax=Tetrahymena thermophila (strain SB210) TaxID=312017 RepID=W7WXV8_TETTS|nr:transmembrane protein, putative [Tetrahymena thermophila SB210]EWS71680.1 transmembrane protein, putative [Tetrahymena thermophila SB210]|eukprot:XP_012655791.1 transmembrane protein, putative [Tetrahymena thermophila SB210]
MRNRNVICSPFLDSFLEEFLLIFYLTVKLVFIYVFIQKKQLKMIIKLYKSRGLLHYQCTIQVLVRQLKQQSRNHKTRIYFYQIILMHIYLFILFVCLFIY